MCGKQLITQIKVKIMKALLVASMLMFMVSACSWQQLGQGAYDSARTSECMKKTGKLECDL